ncbi:hypothetical protein G3A_00875 [Bacillus sp. 17376]|uniref:Uncharacterized protein n=1 Tax=Mesobacillus boroniphilus JCM 21738 TaxID=1294265 RepID=W4RNH1_9BACI|nr:hypothetical protein [Mesobacillus boroniphilus]ESU34493.1 hypothetical protein G3A_00875 [Bacillus sp. 17376]GAE45960.1 hypothetical protein JCM21738_2814 [Mesobacillus boroniphilus JCM 21738]
MGTQIRSFFANDTGDMPNNPTLPVIVYQGVFDDNSQIKNVPIPETDPVYGETGPLLHKWVK